jgi:hypothetical protein
MNSVSLRVKAGDQEKTGEQDSSPKEKYQIDTSTYLAPKEDDLDMEQPENESNALEESGGPISQAIQNYIDARLEKQQVEMEEMKLHMEELKQRLVAAEGLLVNHLRQENAHMKRELLADAKHDTFGTNENRRVRRNQSSSPPEQEERKPLTTSVRPKKKARTRTKEAASQLDPSIDIGVSPGNSYDAAWNVHFVNLQLFKKEYGHYNVFRGHSAVLSEWVSRQRRVLLGKKKGVMNASRQQALKRIGFTAAPDEMEEEEEDDEDIEGNIDLDAYPDGIPAKDYLDRQWNERFHALRKFQREYKHCRVHPGTCYSLFDPSIVVIRGGDPIADISSFLRILSGYNKTLSSWVVYQRQLYNGNKRGNQGETIGMDATRIAALTSLGMHWKHAHKGTQRPKAESDSDSDTEADELPAIASQKRMSTDSKEEAGTPVCRDYSFMSPENPEHRKFAPEDKSWEANLRRLTRFKATKGHLRVTVFNDRTLFIWINRQRQLYRSKGGLKQSRIDSLNAIGFDWKDTKTRRAETSSSEDDDADKEDDVSKGDDQSKSEESRKDEDEPMTEVKAESQTELATVVRDSESTANSELGATVVPEPEGSTDPEKEELEVTVIKAEADEESTTPAVAAADKSQPDPAASMSSSSDEEKSKEDTNNEQPKDKDDTKKDSTPFVLDRGVPENNPRDRVWNLHFYNLQRYKRVHGNFVVSKSVDYSLQEWVSRQRMVYHGNKNGDLNQDRMDALNRIGFVWVGKPSGKFPSKEPSSPSKEYQELAINS